MSFLHIHTELHAPHHSTSPQPVAFPEDPASRQMLRVPRHDITPCSGATKGAAGGLGLCETGHSLSPLLRPGGTASLGPLSGGGSLLCHPGGVMGADTSMVPLGHCPGGMKSQWTLHGGGHYRHLRSWQSPTTISCLPASSCGPSCPLSAFRLQHPTPGRNKPERSHTLKLQLCPRHCPTWSQPPTVAGLKLRTGFPGDDVSCGFEAPYRPLAHAPVCLGPPPWGTAGRRGRLMGPGSCPVLRPWGTGRRSASTEPARWRHLMRMWPCCGQC